MNQKGSFLMASVSMAEIYSYPGRIHFPDESRHIDRVYLQAEAGERTEPHPGYVLHVGLHMAVDDYLITGDFNCGCCDQLHG